MQIISLYRYNRPDGGLTVSPVKPDCDHTEMFRIVADEGMKITNGTTIADCTDTEDVSAWQEVSIQTELEQKAQAYDIITEVDERITWAEENEAEAEATESDYINALAELGVTVGEES